MNQCYIRCELHDYLEIACLYGYQVSLTLKNQQIIEGQAVDLITLEKREYLLIQQGQTQQQVELNQLNKMQVLTANPQFTEVMFD